MEVMMSMSNKRKMTRRRRRRIFGLKHKRCR